jgi:hypothetical protein
LPLSAASSNALGQFPSISIRSTLRQQHQHSSSSIRSSLLEIIQDALAIVSEDTCDFSNQDKEDEEEDSNNDIVHFGPSD